MAVNIHEAKTHFSRLVDRAAQGEEIIIAKNGKPVARLMPLAPELGPRPLGCMRGLIEMTDDFDDELPPEILEAFYGES